MDFAYSPAERELREEVRDWIRLAQAAAQRQDTARLRRHLPGDERWRAISWPSHWGGRNGSIADQFIVEEELCRAGLRLGGGGTAAAHVLAWGDAEQKKRWLPLILSGQAVFAPAFSEEHCGTDLAAVSTRAARSGDAFVLDGSKSYISGMDAATHLMVIARTGAASLRKNGLSVFLLPADREGIRIEPMRTIHAGHPPPPGTAFGEHELSRIVFEGCEVRPDELLGGEGRGWEVITTGLTMDRVSARAYVGYVLQDERFIHWLRSPGGHRAARDAVVRDGAAELWIEREACRLLALRTLSKAAQGRALVPESLVENAFGAAHCIEAAERIAQLAGPAAQLQSGAVLAPQGGLFAHNLLGVPQAAVHHGGVGLMRDLLARYLGLRPRKKEKP